MDNQKVLLEKTVLDLPNGLDRSFKTFTKTQQTADIPTVEKFFQMYEELFFSIPKEGIVNSHSYIIQRSTEYVGFQQETEDIQPLLDEISYLREQILELNTELLKVQIS